MKIGSRSLLFGAHCVPVHFAFVLAGWIRLYGWPRQWQVYLAILIHDLGLWGCETLDSGAGERHPELGARIMTVIAGPEWGSFTIRHSRRYAQLEGLEPSLLCNADKLGTALTWLPLYIFLVKMTGEYREYMAVEQPMTGKYEGESDDVMGWALKMRAAIRKSVGIEES